MKKICLPALLLLILFSCKNAAPDLNGTEKVSTEDFLKAFKTIDLPLNVSDTSLLRMADSTIISKTVFTQFIADSALEKFQTNAIIHPAGIIHKKERDFLMATFSSNKKIQLGVFVLDDKHKFLSSFPVFDNLKKDSYLHSVSITEEPTFILKREKIADNKSLYSRNGFAYSTSTNSFAEVLHDSNEDTARNNLVINPIDTLASINKYSGNYASDKNNFIAIRDGRNAQTYSFFIHFEKSEGDCVGELKGTMTLTNDKEAVYTENGDACVIDFKFTGNTIKIKEQGNCGNHRGIDCPFDFTFKKKNPSAKSTK